MSERTEKRKNRGWLLILLLLAVIFLFYVSCNRQPAGTSDATETASTQTAASSTQACGTSYNADQSTWQQYSHDTVRVAFTYPDPLTVGIENVADIKLQGSASARCASQMIITYIDNVPAPSCDVEYARFQTELKTRNATTTMTDNVQIDGVATCQYDAEFTQGETIEYRRRYLLHRGVRDYTIEIRANAEADIDLYGAVAAGIELN